jgi:hypothetical protein
VLGPGSSSLLPLLSLQESESKSGRLFIRDRGSAMRRGVLGAAPQVAAVICAAALPPDPSDAVLASASAMLCPGMTGGAQTGRTLEL